MVVCAVTSQLSPPWVTVCLYDKPIHLLNNKPIHLLDNKPIHLVKGGHCEVQEGSSCWRITIGIVDVSTDSVMPPLESDASRTAGTA